MFTCYTLGGGHAKASNGQDVTRVVFTYDGRQYIFNTTAGREIEFFKIETTLVQSRPSRQIEFIWEQWARDAYTSTLTIKIMDGVPQVWIKFETDEKTTTTLLVFTPDP
jgi:hypothetical protein